MRSKVAQRIFDNTPEETKIYVDLYSDIVLRINYLLNKQGYSQKKLADNLGKRPSEVNKWLISEHNFTLKSIAKLQAELGEPIINIPGNTFFSSGKTRKKEFTVYKNNHIKTDVKYSKSWNKATVQGTSQILANVS